MKNLSRPAPCTMVIFGGTGDLSKRKILPALFRLQLLDMLPEQFNIIGFATRKLDDGQFRSFAREALHDFSEMFESHQDEAEIFLKKIHFVSSSFKDSNGYETLAKKVAGFAGSSLLFYLATPPSFFKPIVEMLNGNDLIVPGQEGDAVSSMASKLVIEKPFGRDLVSAKALNNLLLQYFDESQIYRIDHYLGKETVQNILFFRFANGIYEPIWNRRYIDHVQITVCESIGVQNRGKYFEEAGMMRDMVQNHILQILSLVAMEPPTNMDADTVRLKKIELLQSIRPIEPDQVETATVRAQYAAGMVNEEAVKGYRQESYVSPESTTETFAALKVMVDNWRWSGVPFYIRTGKRLKKRVTEVSIFFKEVPICLFKAAGCPENNMLTIKIQPDEGIAFQFNAKKPGSSNQMEIVEMDFSYKEFFPTELPEAYERLIYDCMMGDPTLFPHKDGIEASWAFIDMIFKGWEQHNQKVYSYQPESWGPKEADLLIGKDARKWKLI